MNASTLLLRADASPAIGIGHIMRCLALAQAWQDAGGRAVFVTAETSSAAEKRLHAEPCDVIRISVQPGSAEDIRETIRISEMHDSDWVVVDDYQFGCEYQRQLKAGGLKVLFIDDYGHARHYFADLVLNQNLSADEKLYQNREPWTELLLGSRYSLLRREFRAWREWRREIPQIGRRVLITLGGSNQPVLMERVIQALNMIKREDLEATVVIGGNNSDTDGFCCAPGDEKIMFRTNVSNMAELMVDADVAIAAAGSTCWELCLLGLPALLIDVAMNQTDVAQELDRRGCAIHIGNSDNVSAAKIADSLKQLLESHELRLALSLRSRELVDGGGAHRVASLLRNYCDLRIRPARPDDVRLLWEWANDPVVREASFSPEFIRWEDHVVWFSKKLQDRRCFIFVAEDHDGKSVGQVRFDSTTLGDFDVGISVAKANRGHGLASSLIKRGVEAVCSEVGERRFNAFVRPHNQASIKAFERAGFKNVGETDVRGNAAVHLTSELA